MAANPIQPYNILLLVTIIDVAQQLGLNKSWSGRYMPKTLKINNFDGSNFTTHEYILDRTSNPQQYHGAQTLLQYSWNNIAVCWGLQMLRYFRYCRILCQNEVVDGQDDRHRWHNITRPPLSKPTARVAQIHLKGYWKEYIHWLGA